MTMQAGIHTRAANVSFRIQQMNSGSPKKIRADALTYKNRQSRLYPMAAVYANMGTANSAISAPVSFLLSKNDVSEATKKMAESRSDPAARIQTSGEVSG